MRMMERRKKQKKENSKHEFLLILAGGYVFKVSVLSKIARYITLTLTHLSRILMLFRKTHTHINLGLVNNL